MHFSLQTNYFCLLDLIENDKINVKSFRLLDLIKNSKNNIIL